MDKAFHLVAEDGSCSLKARGRFRPGRDAERVGDLVEATLLGFQDPLKGRIESITGGISAANAASSTQGLPNVDPIFTWVRLAQRIPVRIRIEQVPPDVPLVAGMTCSVSVVSGKQAPARERDQGIFDRLISRLG